MFGGDLRGSIRSIGGTSGFTPYFRLPFDLNYQNHTNPSAVLDVMSVTAAAHLSFSSQGMMEQGTSYLGPAYLDTNGSLGTITVGGSGTSWSFLVDANHALLHRVEEERKGRDVILRLALTAVALIRGTQNDQPPNKVAVGKLTDLSNAGSSYCSHEIPKSKWLELLKAVGYGEYHMAEIPMPKIRRAKGFDASLQNVQRAWEHFLNGNDRETLAACHDALEKLAKESVSPQSNPDQNAFTQLLAGTGHPEKVRRIAQVLSQCRALLHLGRHEHAPAVELDHRDAELGILLTHACIAYLSKTVAENKQRAKKKA